MDIEFNWTTCFAVAGYIAANPAVRQAIAWAVREAMRIRSGSINWKRLAAPASLCLILLALLAQAPAAAQMMPRRSRTAAPAGVGADPSLSAAVATFDGTLRAITKKDFTVDLDNGNTVVFKIAKKTTFFVGEKPVKAKELAAEAIVKVEGVKDGFGVLTATKLTVKLDTPQ
jgi:hypothetical protein